MRPHQSNEIVQESGLYFDWLVEVQTVKRREGIMQMC